MRSLMEMANIYGRNVKTDDIDFSFYFSDKTECNHSIRVKIKWNKQKIMELDGYMELHGDYQYVASSNASYTPSAKEIKTAQKFFKKYKVLFAAVWEKILEPYYIQEYLRGNIQLYEVIDGMELSDPQHTMRLWRVDKIYQLEQLVREWEMFNMND